MIFASTTGFIHLIASILALIFGTLVIASTKGTPLHRKMGYLYAASMTVLIVTAFMIYRLFGGFGVFHVAAVISAIALAGGIIPAILRRPRKLWLGLHFNFMYWSVMGLYAAFTAEILTRIPQTRFLGMVAVATLVVMGIANVLFVRFKDRWKKIEAAYIGSDKPA